MGGRLRLFNSYANTSTALDHVSAKSLTGVDHSHFSRVHLPYDIRKFLLDFARIQSPVLLNRTLHQTYLQLTQEYVNLPIPQGKLSKLRSCGYDPKKKFLKLSYIVSLLDNIYDNPFLCSILSYFVRAEKTEFPEQFLAAGRKVIDKELSATQLPNRPQALDYRCLFTGDRIPIHEETSLVPTRTMGLWSRHIESLRHKYESDRLILFPHYNKRKTVSYPTQQNLSFDMFGFYPKTQQTHLTSADLLLHYYRTGRQVQGEMELRTVWFLTDLKPRGYYCLGYVSNTSLST